jgi:PIN domain nuclease of toxin-antitoxin system
LSPEVRALIADRANQIVVSSAPAWEIATKVRLGKLIVGIDMANEFAELLALEGFLSSPITVDHGMCAGLLPGPHKDPFDRMLIAQARIEGVPIASNEQVFSIYDVQQIW